MVNFDYGVQIFSDECLRIYMNCFAIFIFHDEEMNNKRKSVMFGPINANSNVITDEDFYKNLPLQVRKKKLGDVGAEIPSDKHKFALEMLIDPTAKKNHVNISMRRLKFFVRPQVFKDIS